MINNKDKIKLMLFDVDGTLIRAKPKEVDYWALSIINNFKINIKYDEFYREGMVDREIMCKLLELNGIKNPEKDSRFEKALKDLGSIFEQAVKENKVEVKIIPEVIDLLKLMSGKKYIIGLLTGNTPEKAKAKLRYVKLLNFFKIGAYGDKTKIRSKLVPIAIKQAKEKTGISFRKKDVYIIGDTVKDIACAKKAGIKVIAMATGKENIEKLKKEKPDYAFKDYSNPKKIIEAIEND